MTPTQVLSLVIVVAGAAVLAAAAEAWRLRSHVRRLRADLLEERAERQRIAAERADAEVAAFVAGAQSEARRLGAISRATASLARRAVR